MERFNEINIDGKNIYMTSKDGIWFIQRNHFNYEVKIQDTGMAFDFFRNYAPLVSGSEIRKAWDCYRKARKQVSTGTASAFWNYMDGKKLVRHGTRKFISWA